MTFTATHWLILAAAIARLTRIVTTDAVSERLRVWIVGQPENIALPVSRPRLAMFLACPWCISVYVASICVVASIFGPSSIVYLWGVFACSEVAGLLGSRE